jgi:hypothetical protein
VFSRVGPWEIAVILGVLFTIPVYFTPTIIAIVRKTENIVAIILVNILAGWTFIGWVASLVWAIVDNKKPEPHETVENSQTLE